MTSSVMTTYKRLPVTFKKGEGARLWDNQGKVYLDAISGIAVCGLGHAHPAVRDAICAQAGELIHTSNLYGIERQETLATELARISGMDKVFFANSGAEANEAALKIARMWGHKQDIEKPAVVVMENSFHGRTLATLSATGNRKVQAGFEPLVSGFVRLPYGDVQALEAVAESANNVAAVLVEPVQGEGGVNIPAPDYLNRVREICDRKNWLMMLDEIQTGMGRTGRMFAHQHNGISPDVMTLAKGLGNGVPIGACLVKGKADVFGPGNHGSTFGGNPLACAAGAAVIATIEKEGLVQRAASLGAQLRDQFRQRLGNVPGVVDIRGLGLMIGIELDRPCANLVTQALERGLLINVTTDKVIRLLPPLVLSDVQAEELLATVTDLVATFTRADS